MGDVPAQRVTPRKVTLQGCELGHWISLKANEQQSSLNVAGRLINAIDVVVAPPKDPQAAIGVRRRDPHMRVELGELWCIVFVTPSQWGATCTLASNNALLTVK